MDWAEHTLLASDHVRLATYRGGRPDAPTILFVHGFPDDHRVWDGVAGLVASDFQVVTFDVRGSGASQAPGDRAAFRLDQLADDIALVAGSVSDVPVHLVAHDWGSTQAWRAATDPEATARFATFTSISGPDLAMGGAWLKRAARRDLRRFLGQLRKSWYLPFFRLPVAPELFWRSGLGFRGIGRPKTAAGVANARHGLNLYRANLGRSAGIRARRCEVRTQVLAPRHDRFIGVPMQTQAPAHWTGDLHVETIDGGHWVLEQHPDRIAAPLRSFIG